MNNTQQYAQVPITDLLDAIPLDARMTYEVNPIHHHMIPVGRHAAVASSRIKELECENAELREELDADHMQRESEAIVLLRDLMCGSSREFIEQFGWANLIFARNAARVFLEKL